MNEEFYVGQIFEEMYPDAAASWANANNSKILEIEPADGVRRFEIFEKTAPTVDDKKKAVRSIRDQYINNIEWSVSRYRDQTEIQVETTDSAETYIKILQYMQYLRDYPESSETWYEQNPLDFNSWCELSD